MILDFFHVMKIFFLCADRVVGTPSWVGNGRGRTALGVEKVMYERGWVTTRRLGGRARSRALSRARVDDATRSRVRDGFIVVQTHGFASSTIPSKDEENDEDGAAGARAERVDGVGTVRARRRVRGGRRRWERRGR